MQEHVKLEVALEIIMANIADEILKTKNGKNSKISQLMNLQEKAYMADTKAIEKILEENECE